MNTWGALGALVVQLSLLAYGSQWPSPSDPPYFPTLHPLLHCRSGLPDPKM